MKQSPLDLWISSWGNRLSKTAVFGRGVVFSYAAEKLLPLYSEFERRHKWGNTETLRQVVDCAWLSLDTLQPMSEKCAQVDLDALSPPDESFDAPDSTYAQDVVICTSAARSAILGEPNCGGELIEYAIEPLRMQVLLTKSGYVQSIDDEIDLKVIEDGRLSEYLREFEHLITMFEGSVARENVRSIRKMASSKQLNAVEFFARSVPRI